VVDCQSRGALADISLTPDVVIASEVIEQLEAPGAFLDEMYELLASNGLLVISTPNPQWLTGALAALLGREIVNPDHVDWHSIITLLLLPGRINGVAVSDQGLRDS